MTDIATLGFAVESNSLKTAETNLKGVQAEAAKTERAVDKMAAKSEADFNRMARTAGVSSEAQAKAGKNTTKAVDAMRAASIAQASATTRAGAALTKTGESAEAASLRIRAMVKATSGQTAANKLLGESERSVAERQGLRVEATAAQRAATAAQIKAQERLMLSTKGMLRGEALETVATDANTVAHVANTEAKVVNSRVSAELGILFGELASGNYSRMKRSTAALANQTGLLAKLMSPLGLSIIGVGVAIVGFAIAAVKGVRETYEYNKALIQTGNYAGQTAYSLGQMAESLSGFGTTEHEAAAVLAEVAASGKFTASQIKLVGEAALDMSKLTGQAVGDTIKQFEELQKEPLKAVMKLDEAQHFLTTSIYEQIKALDDQGRSQDAANLAAKTYYDTIQARGKEAEQSLSNMATGWQNIKGVIGGATDAVIGFFRQGDIAQKLAALQKSQEVRGLKGGTSGLAIGVQAQIDTYKKQLAMVVSGKAKADKDSLASQRALALEQWDAEAALYDTRAQKRVRETLAAYNKANADIEKQLAAGDIASATRIAQNYVITNEGIAAKYAEHAGKVRKSADTGAEAMRKQAAMAKANATAFASLATIQDRLVGSSDPLSKAWADSAKVMRDIAKQGSALIKNGTDEATVQDLVSRAVDAATASRNRDIDAAKEKMAIGERIGRQALREANLAGMSQRDQEIARAGLQAENELKSQGIAINDKRYAQNIAIAQQNTAMAFDIRKHLAFAAQVAQEFAGFWMNAASSVSRALGDLLTGQTRKFSDFGKSLKSIAQQFVSDIIAQFVRLRILGPLMAGAMGSIAGFLGIGRPGGGSVLQIAKDYYGDGGSISGAPNASGSRDGAGGSGSYASMLSSISLAKNAWLTSTGMFGTGTSVGNIADVGVQLDSTGALSGRAIAMNPWQGMQPAGGTLGGMSTLGLGGGALGAAWGLGRGSGGVSTAASTATGAIGGYYAGTAIATGISGGVAAGMEAIPGVGWIALAAMAVDQISGGKLFGTKYQATAADQAFRLTDRGGVASSTVTEKKQRALFGGAKWRNRDQAVSPELQQAADQFYNGVKKTMVQGAMQLGVDVPTMIDAALKTHSDVHKGKVTGTDYIVEYLGQTWKEATAEAAAQRIGAEALVSVVAASAGAVAQQIAQQFRSSAETLADGAQTMLAAQTNINRGNEMVALGTTATLAQVIAFTQSMQAAGEKLADTYGRLAQASASYLQFVGQFEPAGAGFAYTMQQINKTMMTNIDQANQLAIAAGLSGAREKDLANIHRFAAQQAADAITALSSASQDLATSLYGTVQGLSNATSITAKLTSKLQASTQLAIGDNSPLNEKAKLDIALKGLRSGITSADDVLSIGRKLYASSADYTGLYNKVLQITGMTGGNGGSDDLGAALANYNKLSAQAQATSRFGDAKQLAQNISDISSVQGVGYGEIANGLGVNLQDLSKDLGLTDIRGYLDTLKQEDVGQSVVSSSLTIVDAVRGIGHDIVAAILGGPVVSPGPTSARNISAPDPGQTSLLASIDARLAAIEQHSGDTAKTNKTMVGQGTTSDLRSIAGSTRGGSL